MDLRACDCTIEGKMLKVYIASSKNDQLRQVDEVLIARTRSSTCPVAMMEHYMEKTGIRCNDQCFLFSAIQNTKNGEVLRQSGKLSYICINDLYNKKLTSLGYSAADFGLYSLRSGGATTAANAGGCLRT